MITKNQIKLISSLQQKKFRKQHQLFIAEGKKVIDELLNSSFKLNHVYYTQELFPNLEESLKTQISTSDLNKISALVTPNECLALFEIPKTDNIILNEGIKIVLDDIRDPGNLGTIIRLADWFGIQDVICSEETADVYNPKVIQATMGSISRVNVHYLNLENYLREVNTSKIYGTFMDGSSIYKENLDKNALIVLGNEANGISKSIEKLVHQKISIPRFGTFQKTESLNVATATAIVLSEFCRNN